MLNKSKKVISIILSILMLTSSLMIPATVGAEESEAWTYEMLEDGTVKITGFDASKYDGAEDNTEYGYSRYFVDNLIVPNELDGYTVTELGSGLVCEGCDTIENEVCVSKITIPSSIKYIQEVDIITETLPSFWAMFGTDDYGFKGYFVDEKNQYYCSKDGILFNKDKSTIYSYPLNTDNIKDYVIPDSVTRIAQGCFYPCSLTGLFIPDSVTELPPFMIASAFLLKNLRLPETIKSIPDYCLMTNCNFDIYIPENVEYITGNDDNYPGNGFKNIYGSTDVAKSYAEQYKIPYYDVNETPFPEHDWTTHNYIKSIVDTREDSKLGTVNKCEYKCSDEGCDASYVLYELPDITTDYDYEDVSEQPTCNYAGYYKYECTEMCIPDELYTVYGDEIEATGHNYVLTSHSDATCTKTSVDVYTCSNCQDTKTEYGDLLPHNYQTVVTEPTCISGGYTTHTCSLCGDSYVTDYINATGNYHCYVPYKTIESDCTHESYVLERCKYCGTVRKRTLSTATQHEYKIIKEVSPTCGNYGYVIYQCEKCENSYTEYIKSENNEHEIVKIDSVPATCTISGLTEGEKCLKCGKIITSQKEIPATGHKYNKTTLKPTSTKDGYEKYTCKLCGDSYTEVLKKTGVKTKSLKINWKKNKKCTGYQIQISESKNFKSLNSKYTIKNKNTTFKTVKNLKTNETYFIRIRSYKKTKNTVKYSGWTIKKVKIGA